MTLDSPQQLPHPTRRRLRDHNPDTCQIPIRAEFFVFVALPYSISIRVQVYQEKG